MPGFTKAQLIDKALSVKAYAWCRRCRLYWHKRSIRTHRHVGSAKVIVKFHIPPSPKPKKGDVVIIHPAYERFLNFLVDDAIKQWQEGQFGNAASVTPGDYGMLARQRGRAKGATNKPVYDVLTVDEAVAKLGMTREEIMAEFDDILTRYEKALAKLGGPASTPRTPESKD